MQKWLKFKHFGLTFWVVGFIAFVWVIARSGLNPKRLAYPCQRAAFPLVSAWFLAFISLLGGLFVTRHIRKASILTLVILVFAVLMISSTKSLRENLEVNVDLPVWEVSNPISNVFVMNNIPSTTGSLAAGNASVPDASLPDPAMDTLFQIMASEGLYLYETATHPTGIVGSEDVVVIKGNFQWDSRLGTSTDRIKGLVWAILNHPDGFQGEILVCDNTQQYSVIDENKNNSEDDGQSIIDVVNTFNAKGYPVYLGQWVSFRETQVDEFNTGDTNNGYVYEEQTKISYPKFITPGGAKVSLRYGIYDQETNTWDKDKLCIINFPVVKAHGMMGATLGIKNWVGMLTTADNDSRFGGWSNMHYQYFWSDYALISRVMEVTFPDLTILDATWTSGHLNYEMDLSYNFHTRCLVASTDPLASSWYASKYVLNPLAYSSTDTDPDNTSGQYGSALVKLTAYLIDSAKLDITMDPDKMSVYDRTSLTGSTTIDEQFNPNDINIYPNPAIEGITIVLPNIHLKGVEIIDSKGIVHTPAYKKTGTEIQVNLTDYPVGAYYAIIRTGTKEITRSFIKR